MPLETLVALGQGDAFGGLVCCGILIALPIWAVATTVANRRRARQTERQDVADAKARAEEIKAKELAESKTRRCPYNDCRHENKLGARFCGQCGRFMDGSRNA